MSRRKKIQQLGALTGMDYDQKVSAQVGLQRQIDALDDKLAELDMAVRARVADMGGDQDAAFGAGADLRWHKWVLAQKTMINTHKTQLMAERETASMKVARAYGRKAVVEKLMALQRAKR